jgi:two-component system phosphate regulon response regulator PhoB
MAAQRSPVLLAARDCVQRAQLERALRQNVNWQIQHTAVGDVALRLLGTTAVHLLLIDAGLPIVSAEELCRIIRNRPQTAGLPVVFLEFDALDIDRQSQAFSAGADDYVDATAPPAAVLDRLRAVLLRRRSSIAMPRTPSSRYKSGRLVANFDDVFVSVDGRPIVMQRLEYLLLRYLIERRNQLVTRHDLLRDVWRGRGHIDSRTIDVHVCRLRRKLGPAGEHIQTLVSQGYRFIDAPAE